MASENQTKNWTPGQVLGTVVVLVVFLGICGYTVHKVKVGPVELELKPGEPHLHAQPQLQLPPPAPANVAQAVRPVWMQHPEIWYGPFPDGSGVRWFGVGGFEVWNPAMVAIIPYPDFGGQLPRNRWYSLLQSHFQVLVDDYGNVFVDFKS